MTDTTKRTTTVTAGKATFDGFEPEWAVTVRRCHPSSHAPMMPSADDFPTDVLQALEDWASEGLVGRAEGSPE